jgi:phenylalanine-4-hydroxylase
MNPHKQNYALYKSEDHEVWTLLFDRQFKNLPSMASTAYLDGIQQISFKREFIPDFEETNAHLRNLTGWELYEVPNIIPGKDFFQLLNNKKFCATTWIRKMSQLEYLEEPDMFHDVFGHAPLLTNDHFCDFFHGLSCIAMRYIDNPLALELLGRIYWFTVEFGLIREDGKIKIYGAGILSSPGETLYSLGSTPEHISYDVEKIMNSPYRTDIFQEKYFIIESYEQLYNSIDEIENCLLKNLNP